MAPQPRRRQRVRREEPNLWRLIRKLFLNLKNEWVLKPISTLLSVAFMWIFHALTRMCPHAAANVMRFIAKTYYTPPREWAAFVSEYMERLTGYKITIDDIIREGIGIGGRRVMETLGEKFLTPMLGLLMPDPREIERDPLGGAERFLGTNLQFQLSAWLLHLIGDMQSFGMFKSLKDLPNALSWSYGLGWLSWMVMGPVFRVGISQGMEKHFNKIYTPELFTVAQAIDALRHGKISSREYLDELLKRGIHPEKALTLYEITQKDYSDGVMRTLLELGWMTEEEAQQEFKRRGYDESRSLILARLLRDDRKFELIAKIADEAGDLFREEVIDESTYRRYLALVGYREDEQGLVIAHKKLERMRRRYLTPAQVVQAWRREEPGTRARHGASAP